MKISDTNVFLMDDKYLVCSCIPATSTTTILPPSKIIRVQLILRMMIILILAQLPNQVCTTAQWNATFTIVGGTTGSSGNTTSRLRLPYDIFVDGYGNTYVADYSNNRIQRFSTGMNIYRDQSYSQLFLLLFKVQRMPPRWQATSLVDPAIVNYLCQQQFFSMPTEQCISLILATIASKNGCMENHSDLRWLAVMALVRLTTKYQQVTDFLLTLNRIFILRTLEIIA